MIFRICKVIFGKNQWWQGLKMIYLAKNDLFGKKNAFLLHCGLTV